MLDLDLRGIPGAMVATTAFREAAAAQSRSLGFEPAIVWIPHPVQDRTDDELRALADDALDEVLAAITST
jgi:hypothetical protein